MSIDRVIVVNRLEDQDGEADEKQGAAAEPGRYEEAQDSMSSEEVAVFFYGLFMDEALLISRGIRPSTATVGYVEGYALRIGRRATLVPDESNRAYGVLMTIRAEDLSALYSEESVADYVSESVSVALPDATLKSAVCYILPESALEGTNPRYADSLLTLAGSLGLPGDYLEQIRKLVT